MSVRCGTMDTMTDHATKTSCNRCGTCCLQGGPALHTADKALLDRHDLEYEDLITVRRGELALQPLADRPQPVTGEFIKLRGQGREWSCLFYDLGHKGCRIYSRRPMACGLLDCTAPEAILALAGKDLLDRFACMGEDDPLLPLVRRHEELCPCPDLAEMVQRLIQPSARMAALADLTRQVNEDMAFRNHVIGEYGLPLGRELFYFGRPLFQLLMPLGVMVSESPGGLVLRWQERE